MPVRILEDALIDQIAAGEVVERPASVVKELVENALDAGATTIRVLLKGGGNSLIRIADDGVGMDRQDAVMCLERHATSKITNLDDLVRVRTLGFRGEAMPSIASVSRMEILTRPHDAEIGTRVAVEGGQLQGVKDAGCAPGTQITVRSLFFNLPVRRAFLRTAPTELGHCVDAVTREVMLRPDVDVRVSHDGRDVIVAPKAPDRRARVRALLGKVAEDLREVDFEDRGLTISGLASPASAHQGSGRHVHLYVNGRFVRDPILRRAIREAYQGIVPRGRHPVVVLDVGLDPELVDVNAHPAKTEVRFRNPRDVVDVVASGLREALHRHGIQRQVRDQAFGSRTRRPDPAAQPLPFGGLSPHPADDPHFRERPPEPAPPPTPELPPWLAAEAGLDDAAQAPQRPPPAAPVRPAPSALPPTQAAPAPSPEPLQPPMVLATLGPTAAVIRRGDQVLVVDTLAVQRWHARASLEAGEARRLLVPHITNPGRALGDRLVAWREGLEGVGLSLGPLGPGEIAVKRVPGSLIGADWDAVLPALAERLRPARPQAPDQPLPEAALDALCDGAAVGTTDIAHLLADLPPEALAPPIARALDGEAVRAFIEKGGPT